MKVLLTWQTLLFLLLFQSVLFLWEHISTAAGAAIEAVTTIAWIIPVSLLVSGDTRQCATDNGNDDVQTSAGQKTDRYGNVLGGKW
jgi:hypothetical protein